MSEHGSFHEAARATAQALRREAAVARAQAELSRERSGAIRAVAAAAHREANLTPEGPGRSFRHRQAEFAEQHARISDREVRNFNAEADRSVAEAANAEARAVSWHRSPGPEAEFRDPET